MSAVQQTGGEPSQPRIGRCEGRPINDDRNKLPEERQALEKEDPQFWTLIEEANDLNKQMRILLPQAKFAELRP